MATGIKYPACQAVMNRAYDLWQKYPDWTYSEFIDELSPADRSVVLIGNLNYQVENGGFSQWLTNGYGECVRELARALDAIGAVRVAEMVYAAVSAWQVYQDQRRRARLWWSDDNDDDDDSLDFEAMDAEYYRGLGETLMQTLETAVAERERSTTR